MLDDFLCALIKFQFSVGFMRKPVGLSLYLQFNLPLPNLLIVPGAAQTLLD